MWRWFHSFTSLILMKTNYCRLRGHHFSWHKTVTYKGCTVQSPECPNWQTKTKKTKNKQTKPILRFGCLLWLGRVMIHTNEDKDLVMAISQQHRNGNGLQNKTVEALQNVGRGVLLKSKSPPQLWPQIALLHTPLQAEGLKLHSPQNRKTQFSKEF